MNTTNANCQLKTANSPTPLLYALCLFLIFIFSFLIEAKATTRYVSHTGTSTPPYTTWETAADSIQKAINICLPGDTVIVANGVYNENLIVNTQITLIGSSMDSTVIDGRGMGDFTTIFNASGSIENFNIYGRGIGLSGAAIRNLQSINFINIRNCQITETSVGIAFANSSIKAENIIMKNLSKGFDLGSINEFNYSISDCIIVLDQQNSQGIHIGFASQVNALITDNIILFTGLINPYFGISIGAVNEVHITNNLINGFRNGIYFDTVLDTAFVNNNVIIYNNLSGILSIGSKIIINNSIITKNDQYGIWGYAAQEKSDYNLFWGNNIDLRGGLIYGDSDRVADPMFVKDTLPNPQLDFDYHIQAFSPGIDKGDPNIFDVDDSRSDIGLYGGPLGESYTYQDLAPHQPVNLLGVVDSSYILLSWNRNSEADTFHYNVYRDTIPGFTIDSTKLTASPADTFFIQYPPYENNQYVYKITCVDNQGNESLPSEEVVIKPVSVNEYPHIVNDYYLYQNYPNPFNPSTTIGYKLKERGYVKLMVYDIKGEMISVLVNKELNAGYYEVEFGLKSQDSNLNTNLASGIYLYRIEIIGEGRIPVYSDMKKMILIK